MAKNEKRWLRAKPDGGIRRRIALLAVLLAVGCLGGLAVRLAGLMLADNGWYAERAAAQQLRDTVVPAPRGEILAADGRVLAANETCWSIRAAPRELADGLVAPAAHALAGLLDVDEADILKKLQKRQSNDCLIKRRVTAAEAEAVRSWCAENGAEGILILEDVRRVYPEGSFAGCVLGFTNVDGQGAAGLELQYNGQLQGTNGLVLTAKNAWGYNMPVAYATAEAAVPGNTLHLTLDADLQHTLERCLAAAVAEHHVAARAVGIVMDVNTGGILAMSVQPDYDPNSPRALIDEKARALVDSLEGEARTEALQLAQQGQWRNKAISDLYEPGSVFKLITASAALDSGAVNLQNTFSCSASYSVAGTRFHCANNKRHGVQNIAAALQNSCNQSFIQIGQRLGKEAFCDYFAAFGLRQATGIDLPGEAKRSEYYTADKMGPVELASCAFGQSSKISYIQMLTAVCAVVNGGKLLQPYLVDSITDANGNLLQQHETTVRTQVISAETSATMRNLMEKVVLLGGGRNAAVAGYRIGGKSGTSQKLDSEDEKARIASFVGVAPIDAPRYAVLVCLDEPHSWTTAGGSLSAPVVARVLEAALEKQGLPRQYTDEQRAKLTAVLPDAVGDSPQYATERLAERGFAVDVRGGGEKVVAQCPAAGVLVPRGSTIVLYTTREDAVPMVSMPNIIGKNLADAEDTLRRAGLNPVVNAVGYLPKATVLQTDAKPGDMLQPGSLVEVQFAVYTDE